MFNTQNGYSSKRAGVRIFGVLITRTELILTIHNFTAKLACCPLMWDDEMKD